MYSDSGVTDSRICSLNLGCIPFRVGISGIMITDMCVFFLIIYNPTRWCTLRLKWYQAWFINFCKLMQICTAFLVNFIFRLPNFDLIKKWRLKHWRKTCNLPWNTFIKLKKYKNYDGKHALTSININA